MLDQKHYHYPSMMEYLKHKTISDPQIHKDRLINEMKKSGLLDNALETTELGEWVVTNC